jgi:uncharacterized HAD superfamily protein
MRIGIDIDNVISETVPPLLKQINRIFHEKLNMNNIYMYDFHAILGISEAEMKERFWDKQKIIENVFKTANPVKGAADAIKILSSNNEIILVTDRPKEYMRATKEWLGRWQISFDEKEIWHMVGGVKMKHAYAEFRSIHGLGFDAFVDDNLEDVIMLTQHCKKVFLYKRPWNSTRNTSGSFCVVSNWNEIIDNLSRRS